MAGKDSPGGKERVRSWQPGERMAFSTFFGGFTPGEPKPWWAVHQGIEYPGEILVAESWAAGMGGEIKKDLHFRIVALTRYQEVPPEHISDHRIALCIPAKPTTEAKRLAHQYLAIQEAKGTYEANAGLEGKEGAIKAKLWQQQVSLYAAGQVVTRSRLSLNPRDIFATTDSQKAFNLIAGALLAEAYPLLPLDTSALPKTISAQVPGLVFNGFFGMKSQPEAQNALDSFAVALGLARPDDPRKFAPEGCPIFSIVNAELEKRGGSLSVSELYQKLAVSYGLPWPLITLYLLCFVCYSKPAVELRLRPGHGLIMRSGQRLAEDNLTSATATEVWWKNRLEEDFEALCYSTQPLWNTALPYARLIDQKLTPCAALSEIEGQENLLLARLEELGTALNEMQNRLDLLSTRLGTPPPKEALDGIGRLRRLSQCQSYFDFYDSARREYKAVEALVEDLALYHRLCQLDAIVPEILKVKSYLDGMVLRAGDTELAMDRLSIVEQFNPGNLIAAPHLWLSVQALFQWFKPRYLAAYQSHHLSHNQELASLRASLIEARPEIEALKRLNSVGELGLPLGEELISQHQHLLDRIKPCPSTSLPESYLQEQPQCPDCRISLITTPPTEETEQFLSQLRQALKQQLRRLSSETMRQVLSQSQESRLEQFIKVIQTSDLSSLANVLDDELVDFLNKLLAEARTFVQKYPLSARLAQRFPTITEDQIDQIAAELAALLREAFTESKRKNPNKRIRIVFD